MQVGAIAVRDWRIYLSEWDTLSADQGSGCCCILFREWHQVLHVIARSEDGPGFRWKFQGAGSNLLADPREQLFATHLHCTGVQLKPVICSIFPVWESISTPASAHSGVAGRPRKEITVAQISAGSL